MATLNEEQRKAVTAPIRDHVQILAGPGTGKTKCMASRIAWLIQQGIPPSNIVALTFTNAAAKELISRVGTYVGDHEITKHLKAGTFHSVCAKLLYKFHGLIGIQKSFNISDDRMKTRMIKKAFSSESFVAEVKNAGYELIGKSKGWACPSSSPREGTWNAQRVSSAISLAKNKGYTFDAWPEKAKASKFLVAAYRSYTEMMQQANLLDFDDLLIYGNKLIREHPQVLQADCVLVDEFQDTNEVQFDLMCAFAVSPRGLTIVGDPDQSIYAFRGACSSNFKKMIDVYPGTKVFYLQTNYRSLQPILNISMALMAGSSNRDHGSRTLNSHSHDLDGGAPHLLSFRNEQNEASAIERQIRYLTSEHGSFLKYNHIAILFRYRKQISSMEPTLLRANIPYTIVGGTNFWDTYEVGVIFDYLKMINSNFADDALIETINVPARGIGPKALEVLELADKNYPNGFEKLLARTSESDTKILGKMSTPAKEGVAKYVKLIQECRSLLKHSNKTRDVINVVRKIVKDTNLMDHFVSHTGKQPRRIRKNLKILKMMILQMDVPRTGLDEEIDEEDYESDAINSAPDLNGVVPPEVPDYDSDADLDRGENEDDEDIVGDLEFYTPYIQKNCLQRFLKEMTLNLKSPLETLGDRKTKKPPKDAVILSTIHGAKGLEWPVVFLPKLNQTAIYDDDIEEHRRVFFVAMTRAAGLLYLSHNDDYNQWSTAPNYSDTFLTSSLSNVCVAGKGFKKFKVEDATNLAKLVGLEITEDLTKPKKSKKGAKAKKSAGPTNTGFKTALHLTEDDLDDSTEVLVDLTGNEQEQRDNKPKSQPPADLYKNHGFSSGLSMLKREAAVAGLQSNRTGGKRGGRRGARR